MGTFSSRSTLYRTACLFVIWAVLGLVLAPGASAQAARTAKRSKGPRALGLVEFITKDKAHLIPIEILYDGEYYDAGAYKASPVPFAIWSGTVYEGFQSGVSQGLFTVTGALENPQTKDWLAEGTWLPAGAMAAKLAKKSTSSIPRGLDDDSGPPVLRRAPAGQSERPETPPSPPVAPTPQTPPQPQAPSSPPPMASAPTPPSATTPSSSPASAATPADTYHPTLQRGKPASAPPEDFPPGRAGTSQPAAKHAPSAAASKGVPLRLIPAISDADGPEPQSYKYEMKSDEETQLRARTMALAADAVRAWARQVSGATTPSSEPSARPRQRAGTVASRTPQPAFTDVTFRAFDLSNSNEPILVLTAGVRLAQNPKPNLEPTTQTEFLVTFVAREDINGDFHKVFSNVTDADHLDVLPRMDFIDAVDADGDGRGELLFRQVSDAGSSFVIYRVIGDQVWALFQGSPAT